MRLTTRGWACGVAASAGAPNRFNLRAATRRCRKKFQGKARARCVRRAKKKAAL